MMRLLINLRDAVLLLILLFLCLSLLAVLSPAQDKPLPMPPDLLHIKSQGCYIEGHATDPPQFTLDAKTAEEHESRLWTVTPFARYQDLPDGTRREDWVYGGVDENREHIKWIFSVMGTEALLPREATDACSAWMKALDKARRDEARKAGHK